MVKRFWSLLHREVRGLHEAAYLLGFFALLSQLLALVRDRLLAAHFGASGTLDVYYAAFRIPDLIFVSVASLFSLYVLIPFLAEAKAGGEERAFLGRIMSFFTLLIGIVAVVVFAFVPYLIPKLFPILYASNGQELIALTRILLLQPILLGLSNITGSVTQTYGRFALYSVSPLLYNFGIIIGIVFFYPAFGLIGLGYGVVLGALFHFCIQLPFLAKEKFLPRPTFQFRGSELRRVLTLSVPRTLALSANQIAFLILTILAARMAPGAIAAFNFSFNLQAVPLSIIGISYSVAAFPTLTRLFSSGEREKFLHQVVTAARHILFWSLPATVLCIVLRAQIVRVILGAGAFDWSDTRITAAALALFAISLVAQGLVLLFVRGYYAAGNTRIPLIVNGLAAVLVIVFANGFLWLFTHLPMWKFFIESLLRVEDIPRTEMLMLPLGYSLAALLNVGVFWVLFQRHFSAFSTSLSRALFESLSAAVLMGFVVYEFLTVFGALFNINTFWGVFGQGLCAGVIGIAAGVAILWLLGNTEVREVRTALHKRFWQAATIAPETPADTSTQVS